MTQKLAPVSDVAAGSWLPSSGSDLYAMVDETAYSYRLLAGSGTIAVALKQGSTTIASWGPHSLTGSAQDFAQTLTGTQADSITDYSALRVEITSA